jgi:hypothetical protein
MVSVGILCRRGLLRVAKAVASGAAHVPGTSQRVLYGKPGSDERNGTEKGGWMRTRRLAETFLCSPRASLGGKGGPVNDSSLSVATWFWLVVPMGLAVLLSLLSFIASKRRDR